MAGSKMAPGGASGWSETGAITRSNRIDDWIAIEPDGTVRVFSGKVELGTGVRTALAQIVAEELDVPIDSVVMVMGDTRHTPDEGYTAGSKTIQFGGYGLRQAAAEARRVLVERAADRLGRSPESLVVSGGTIWARDKQDRSVSYAELVAGKSLHGEIGGRAKVKVPADYRVVGAAVSRVDLPRKFTGAASFVQDLRLPGMLHARAVHPPAPGAEIVSLDEGSAEGARVVRVGKAFLAVVSEREQTAVQAARALKVEWTHSRPFPPAEGVFETLRSMKAETRIAADRGDVDQALSAGAITAVYHQPYQAHASIGPACAVADPTAEQFTVYCSTQGVYPLRGAIADLLGLSADQVAIVHSEGAGCYGHNGSDDVAAEAALLARQLGTPVRLQWSRADEFAWEPYGPAMVLEMAGAVGSDGRVLAWQHDAWTPSHTTRPRAGEDLLAGQLVSGRPIPLRTFYVGGDRNAATDYGFANERVVMHWIQRSPLRVSSLRSLGATANAFANECFMDELAAAAGQDPVQFRLKHLNDARAREVVERASEAAGWGRSLPPGEGLGIAFSRYENAGSYVATVAHVSVDRESGGIRVKRFFVAHDCGLIINPDGVRNQIEGNLIQGASRALKERVGWRQDGIDSIDWRSYPILTFSEVPDIEIILVDRPEERAVGAGEPATITAAPAIANAVFAAVGARLREVPFSPENVKNALS